MSQTGPRTPEGKAIASRNAVKHGLRSMAMVIPGLEDEHDWRAFHAGVVAYYAPAGAVEYALVDRAAGLLWRLRRASRAERDAAIAAPPDSRAVLEGAALANVRELARQFGVPQDVEETDTPPLAPSPAARPRILPEPLRLLTISRYEQRLNNQLRHILREIENCKSQRKEKALPLYAI